MRGLSTRDIQAQLQDLYGVELSPSLISQVTAAVSEDVRQWQTRPLDSLYPMVWMDALMVEVREEGRVIIKAVYLTLAVNWEGHKELLSLWISEHEGAKFWLGILTELKNREQGMYAFYQRNQDLVAWVNQQPLGFLVYCLGDGHDGIWKLFAQIGVPPGCCEILDWYHLRENLAQVDLSEFEAELLAARLWDGEVDLALKGLAEWEAEGSETFQGYVRKHRERIVDYRVYQIAGISIGSGEVESSVKQVGQRLKLSGAQRRESNVNQVLQQRCAYLNGTLAHISG